jgi:hypothetical protein
MDRRCALIVLALTVGIGNGQTVGDLKAPGKNVDFTDAITTKPFKSGTDLPSTCSVGEAFFKTNSSGGANLYVCASQNAWSAAGPQGGGTVTVNGLSGPIVIAGGGHLTCYLAGQTIRCDVVTNTILSRATDQAGTDHYCKPSSRSGTSYTCGLNPALAIYSEGMWVVLKPDVNSGRAPVSLNVDGVGPITLQKLSSGSLVDIAANDLVAGIPYFAVYNGSVFVVSTQF